MSFCEIIELALLAADTKQTASWKSEAPRQRETANLKDCDNRESHQAQKGNVKSSQPDSGLSNTAQPKSKNSQTRKSGPSKRNPMPKLSPEERDELLAAGKCFRCKGLGHKSSDCPEGETVHVNAAATKRTKPKVAKNFSMSIDPEEFKEAEALAETTEGLDMIHCNVMRAVEQPNNDVGPKPKFIGDLVAIGASIVLREGVPYPGDLKDYDYPERFVIYQFSDEGYTVLDTYIERQFFITAKLLQKPKLDLQNWYRKRCEQAEDEFRMKYWDANEPDLNDSFFPSSTVPEPPHHFELIDEAIVKFLSACTDYG
jgi:hypothetical protein